MGRAGGVRVDGGVGPGLEGATGGCLIKFGSLGIPEGVFRAS